MLGVSEGAADGAGVEPEDGAKEKLGIAAGFGASVAGFEPGKLNLGASEVAGLGAAAVVVVDGNENDGTEGWDFFSSGFAPMNPVVMPPASGAAVDGAVLVSSFCILERIFDIASASRSCFSHFEYDFVLASFGVSGAGEGEAEATDEIRRFANDCEFAKAFKCKPTLVTTDRPKGPLFGPGLSRERIHSLA